MRTPLTWLTWLNVLISCVSAYPSRVGDTSFWSITSRGLSLPLNVTNTSVPIGKRPREHQFQYGRFYADVYGYGAIISTGPEAIALLSYAVERFRAILDAHAPITDPAYINSGMPGRGSNLCVAGRMDSKLTTELVSILYRYSPLCCHRLPFYPQPERHSFAP